MSDPRSRSRARRAAGAFTLIELIVVVAVLASIAGLAVATLSGTQEQVTRDLALNELSEVRKAILQFKADTGFLPKRGPFNLSGRSGPTTGLVVLSSLPGASDTERTAWFDAEENLFQLFDAPIFEANQALSRLDTWNPDRRRGWRGPYLASYGEGRLGRVDSPPVPAIADPFFHATDVDWFSWDDPTIPAPSLAPRRALRLLGLDGGDARITSAGPDGDFGTSDDLVAYLLR